VPSPTIGIATSADSVVVGTSLACVMPSMMPAARARPPASRGRHHAAVAPVELAATPA
jgi:hypothetical protein